MPLTRIPSELATHRGTLLSTWLDKLFMPSASSTPAANGELTVQLTSNTQLTIKVKGSDGVVRTVNLTLA